MKKAFAVGLVLLFSGVMLYAQVPGYLGKRMAVGASLCYAPSYSSLLGDDYVNVNYSGQARAVFFLNSLRFGGSFLYVLSESKTLNFDISYQQNGVTNAEPKDFAYDSYTGKSFLGTGVSFAYARSRMITMSAGVLSSTSHVAPVGAYVGNHLVLVLGTVEALDGKGNVYTLGTPFDFGYCLNFGFRRVFADNFMFDAGVNMNCYFRGLFAFVTRVGDKTAGELIQTNALFKNYFDNFCTGKIAVYYLLK